MKLQNIISQRFTTDKSFWQIVFEWEDIFAKELDLTISKDSPLRSNKIVRHIPGLSNFITTNKVSLLFEMSPHLSPRFGLNKPNIIPLIIDFYLKEEQLSLFYKNYNKHKCVLISSKEVYDYLKQHDCPLPIYHLALSISDEYKIDSSTSYEKVYDLVLMGRPNKLLLDYLDIYSKKHIDFKYIYNKNVNHEYIYFTSDGTSLGKLETRAEFMCMMRKAKAIFYSTPGADGNEHRTNGFNQVTPRFLEQISCGCNIIARYPKNQDTDYYDLSHITSCVNSYEEFERKLDKARVEKADMVLYSEYLSQHYTSVRAKLLSNILSNL